MTGSSYRVALRTTSITGASQVVVLLLKLVKSKVIAVLLGPAGIGLFGILTTVVGFVSAVAGMGMSGSAVRQVAEASASGDAERVAKVVWTIRRVTLASGVLAAVLLLLLAELISRLSFGTTEYALYIRLLSVAVLFGLVSGGQTAVLRGLRRIGDLARLSMWGALWGTALAIPFVWALGLAGIAPALVVAAGLGLLASWWYARRVLVPRVSLSPSEFSQQAKSLLAFGMVFLVTGLLGSLVQYVIRIILVRYEGLGEVGEFQAAATLSMVYVTFILQAMSQDFYPRLTGVAGDNGAINRLVNEQSELSLLLAGPGILATVAVAPWLIGLLYSDQFTAASELLRWQCLGILLRVASWPIGFVLLARGEGKKYVVVEVASHLVHVLAFWLLVERTGLRGAAFALAICYLTYLPLVYLVVRNLCGFSWTHAVVRIVSINVAAFFVVMLVLYMTPAVVGAGVGLAVAVVVAIYSYRRLERLTELPLASRVLSNVRRLLR